MDPSITKLPEKDQREVWRSFTTALGADLREAKTIQGASGIDHPVQAVAVDEDKKRVVIVSAEASARVAALMQVDVQTKVTDARVLVARPVIFDIGALARRLFTGQEPRIPIDTLREFNERSASLPKDVRHEEMNQLFLSVLAPALNTFKNVELPTLVQIMDVVNQAQYIDWRAIFDGLKEDGAEGGIDLSSLCRIDTMAIDRKFGVCPLPLYEFADSDWALFTEGSGVDELRERLRQMDILQYFYPSPDQLALGLVDSGVGQEAAVLSAVRKAAALGHPLGEAEIVPSLVHFTEAVSALKESGHIVEGEYGLEVSSSGATVRSSVKVRPKESLLAKLLGRLNISLSATPKDFLPGP